MYGAISKSSGAKHRQKKYRRVNRYKNKENRESYINMIESYLHTLSLKSSKVPNEIAPFADHFLRRM